MERQDRPSGRAGSGSMGGDDRGSTRERGRRGGSLRSRRWRSSFDVGDSIGAAFSIHGRRFFPITLAALVAVAAVDWIVSGDDAWRDRAATVPGFLVTAAVAQLVFEARRANRISLLESLRGAVGALAPVLIIGVLVSVLVPLPAALAAALAAFLAPASGVLAVPVLFAGLLASLLAGLMLCVAIPAAIIEGRGSLDSLSRSLDLTRRHLGGLILGALVLGLVLALFAFAQVLLQALLPNRLATYVPLVARAVQVAFGAVYVSVLYHDLARVGEGSETRRKSRAATAATDQEPG